MRQVIITVNDDGGLKVNMTELTPFDAIAVLEVAKFSLIAGKKEDIKEVLEDEV